MLNNFIDNPRKLFLIDGIGALVSAFFLGVLLVRFESFFGIPKSALYILAAVPCFFILYDVISYRVDESKVKGYLKGIAFMNLGYVFLSIGMAIYHSSSISIFGWIYIVGEIIILLALITIEYRTANQ